MPAKVPPITIRPKDNTLSKKLKYIAAQNYRSLNKEAELILSKYVENYESKYGAIKVD